MNDTIPLISIIILNYNGGKFIEECIKSIMDSNYSSYEIILVDRVTILCNPRWLLLISRSNMNQGTKENCFFLSETKSKFAENCRRRRTAKKQTRTSYFPVKS